MIRIITTREYKDLKERERQWGKLLTVAQRITLIRENCKVTHILTLLRWLASGSTFKNEMAPVRVETCLMQLASEIELFNQERGRDFDATVKELDRLKEENVTLRKAFELLRGNNNQFVISQKVADQLEVK